MEVGLSLGANLGERRAHMEAARKSILGMPGMRKLAQSPLYETQPVAVPPDYAHLPFLNAVLIVETILSPRQLLPLLLRIEQQQGRQPGHVPHAPRIIDLDIIYAGRHEIRDQDLEVPHPRWNTRRFVTQPLCDVRPDLLLPGQTRSVAAILAGLDDPHTVTIITKQW
ncbi:MAG: 2-amino-4-hydroxy-6-hydroxymethyldihydropteridine diphosphokinase [Kiritimatiellia bacterium]